MPTRNVNLTKHFDQFIEDGIISGRFGNASEVVREGLRLLEQRQQEDKARLAWLQKEAQIGFDQIAAGDYTELNSGRDIDNFVDEIWAEVMAKRKPVKKNA